MTRTFSVHLQPSIDGRLPERLVDTGNLASLLRAALRAWYQEFHENNHVPDEETHARVVLFDDIDADLIEWMDNLPRGGVSTVIRCSLNWYLGRFAGIPIDDLADALASRLEGRLQLGHEAQDVREDVRVVFDQFG